MSSAIKKMLVLFFIGFLSSGCVPTPMLLHPDVLIIGDSITCNTNGTGGHTAAQMAGIAIDCKPGRRLAEYYDTPVGYRIVFLALITNDTQEQTPLDEYRAKLQNVLLADAIVYCILATPSIPNGRAEIYNAIMREECPNVINPLDYGVLPRISDGIHWSKLDHELFMPAITSRL